jgi:threonine/homoserine/homoserine lactone efflux protein
MDTIFTSLLSGLIIGFIIAVPPGPVSIASIRLALTKGSKHSLLLALGSGTVDAAYCLLAVFSTSLLIHSFSSLSKDYAIPIVIIQFLIVIAVISFGIYNLKSGDEGKEIDNNIEFTHKNKFINYLIHKGPFLIGFGIASANIFNPTYMPSLAFITSMVHNAGLINNSVLINILFSVGIGAGNTIWLVLLNKLLIVNQAKISAGLIVYIYRFAGITLIIVGCILAYKIVIMTRWKDILTLII